jgi:hypothetical protein
MKPFQLFSLIVVAALFIFSSCGRNTDAKGDVNKENQAMIKKVDACLLITASGLSNILGKEVKQLGEATYLEKENDFYHYVALCGFNDSELMITIRLAQQKTVTDPKKSRDISHEIQDEDKEKIVFVESLDIAGTPVLYYEEKDSDIDATMNVLILYTPGFETSLICTQHVTKQQMIKIAEKIAESLKKV